MATPSNPIGPMGQDPLQPDALKSTKLDVAQFESALKELNLNFTELYKSTSAAQDIVKRYEQELQRGSLAQQTLTDFQKAQTNAAKAAGEIIKQREEFIAQTRLQLLEKGFDSDRINQIVRELRTALAASEDFSKSLSSTFKVGTKIEPPTSMIENVWKKILMGAGVVGAGEGKKTSDILLSSIAAVSEKILSAVGIFTLFQTVMQAVISDVYQSQKLFGGFSQVLGSTSGDIYNIARETLPALRNAMASTSGSFQDFGKKAFGMMTEEADQAIINFQKLSSQGKITRLDLERAAGGMGASGRDLAVQARNTVIAVDSWGRAAQAFGLTSEQGAEKAGKMMQVFGLQGNALRDSFSRLSINANQSWQTLDSFTEAVTRVGERFRMTGGSQEQVFQRSVREVELFGSLMMRTGKEAGLSGAAISQSFDIMFNRINGLSLSFRLAAMQASGMTQGLDAGKAVFQSYSKGPMEILGGIGSMMSKTFGQAKMDSQALAGRMMMMLQIPADQAALVAPNMERLAKAMQAMPGFAEGKFDPSKLVEAASRAGLSRQQAEALVAAGKATEDPLKAIRKLLENLVKMISNGMNLGFMVRAPFGTEG